MAAENIVSLNPKHCLALMEYYELVKSIAKLDVKEQCHRDKGMKGRTDELEQVAMIWWKLWKAKNVWFLNIELQCLSKCMVFKHRTTMPNDLALVLFPFCRNTRQISLPQQFINRYTPVPIS